MRLWTLHPKYLDARGLVALWREGLLAQKVLRGLTVGYRSHPQLLRFRAAPSPVACIAAFLREVSAEASRRDYAFDATKIGRHRRVATLMETHGQLSYEWDHLLRKLHRRDPERYRQLLKVAAPEPHPLFNIVPGAVREWEKATP